MELWKKHYYIFINLFIYLFYKVDLKKQYFEKLFLIFLLLNQTEAYKQKLNFNYKWHNYDYLCTYHNFINLAKLLDMTYIHKSNLNIDTWVPTFIIVKKVKL